jgi:hypothetical protein
MSVLTIVCFSFADLQIPFLSSHPGGPAGPDDRNPGVPGANSAAAMKASHGTCTRHGCCI